MRWSQLCGSRHRCCCRRDRRQGQKGPCKVFGRHARKHSTICTVVLLSALSLLKPKLRLGLLRLPLLFLSVFSTSDVNFMESVGHLPGHPLIPPRHRVKTNEAVRRGVTPPSQAGPVGPSSSLQSVCVVVHSNKNQMLLVDLKRFECVLHVFQALCVLGQNPEGSGWVHEQNCPVPPPTWASRLIPRFPGSKRSFRSCRLLFAQFAGHQFKKETNAAVIQPFSRREESHVLWVESGEFQGDGLVLCHDALLRRPPTPHD
mmetsp:Transcript_43304/g.85446  ORF Transcript_43304/g.85446 Transcript_43304/m.85446 type:complete len:259 (+) Transcript_43304:121-897(+)